MHGCYYDVENPTIEVMSLLDLLFGKSPDGFPDSGMLVIACTSNPGRYAAFSSERFLLLNFDDSTNPDRKYSFKPAHAQAIDRFIENAYEGGLGVERIIVACDGGVSRSAAVAAALMVRFGQDDESAIWSDPAYSPNRLVFELMCAGLGLRMPKGATDERVKRSERVNGERTRGW